MAPLLLSWLLIGWLSLTLGLFAAHVLRNFYQKKDFNPAQVPIDYLFIGGFLLLTLACSYLSIFLPMDGYTAGLVSTLGVALTYTYRHSWQELAGHTISRWRGQSKLMRAALLLVFLTAFIGGSLTQIIHIDAALYHVQMVKWIKEFAVVPGLGNIHGRFAFNSHYFIPSALFATFFTDSRALFPLASLFYWIIASRLLVEINRSLLKKRGSHTVLYGTLLLWVGFQFSHRLSAISTDDITCILTFYVFMLFLGPVRRHQDPFALALLPLTIFSLITFKLSMLLTLVILPFIFRRFQFRKLGAMALAGLLVAAPFVMRNVYLSGYLLYPVPEIDVLEVDWKIPMEAVVFEKALVAGWARLPNPPVEEVDAPLVLEMSFANWWRAWWPRRTMRWKVVYLFNLLLIPLLCWQVYRKKWKYSILSATILANLIFWFVQAPDPRFAYGFLFFGFALVSAYAFSPMLNRIRFPGKKQVILALLAVYLPVCLFLKPEVKFSQERLAELLWRPGTHEEVKTDIYQAVDFQLHVPKDGKLTCFNAPIPCTPYPKAGLTMRGDQLKDGFKIGVIPPKNPEEPVVSKVESIPSQVGE